MNLLTDRKLKLLSDQPGISAQLAAKQLAEYRGWLSRLETRERALPPGRPAEAPAVAPPSL